MVTGGVVNGRAAKLQALHNAAEARGYNGAQVVAELTRVVVEQGRDWDRAYEQALSFYAPPVVAGEVAADRVAAIGVMLAGWYRRVAVAATEVVAALAKAFGLLGGRRREDQRPDPHGASGALTCDDATRGINFWKSSGVKSGV